MNHFTFSEITADRSNMKDAVYFLRKARNTFLTAAKGGAVQKQLLITEILRGSEKTDSA